MKKCLQCKRNLPLFMFHTDTSKYQRESAKGKVIECRLCTFKRAKRDVGLMSRVDGKFIFIKMSKIKIVRYFFKK